MRIGPFEIVLIIVLIFLMLLIVRMLGMARNVGNRNKVSHGANGNQSQKNGIQTVKKKHYVRAGGLSLILIGILVLLSGLSLFKWIMWSYTGFFILVAVGFLILFLARKR